MNSLAEKIGYGSFLAGVLNLALPISAIREVQPLHDLIPLPCAAKGLLGGLNLRGVVVPVIDLSLLLGFPAGPAMADSIVVVAASGRLIGMSANRVNELFYVHLSAINPIHFEGEQPQFFVGSVCCPGSEVMLNVLDPDLLVALPGLPSVQDPDPQRLLGQDGVGVQSMHQQLQGVSYMLLQSGQIGYAIDPKQVESTLANPELTASSICAGHFMGELVYRGQVIPAIHLNLACGFKNDAEPHALREACVVRLKEGAVAFMVERVVDMVNVNPTDFVSLVKDGNSPLALVDKVMPNGLLGAESVKKHQFKGRTHFVLSDALIQSDTELNNLARLLAKRKIEGAGTVDCVSVSRGEYVQESRLLTFLVQDEMATPIESIVKVIPYNASLEMLPGEGALLGYVFDQGENIQVYSLSHLLTGRRQSLGVHSSILIVQCASAKLGFAVRSLKTIESARWKNTIPVLGEQRLQPGNFGQTSHLHVELGTDRDKRMLRVLDLVAIADSLTGPVKQTDADSLDVLDLLPELLDQHL